MAFKMIIGMDFSLIIQNNLIIRTISAKNNKTDKEEYFVFAIPEATEIISFEKPSQVILNSAPLSTMTEARKFKSILDKRLIDGPGIVYIEDIEECIKGVV